MIVGPVVEGHSEERVVNVILKWLGIKHRPPLRADGKQDLIARGSILGAIQRRKGATHILYVFDADGPDQTRVRDALPSRLDPSWADTTSTAIPVYELEAWLLADEQALSNLLETTVDRIARPEAEPDPASVLDRIFRSAGTHKNGYIKAVHSKAIADHATDKAWRRCASYEQGTAFLRRA